METKLSGQVITAAAQFDPDYTMESDGKFVNGTWNLIGGLAVEIFLDLEFSLNFTAKAIRGEGWLDQGPNGSWIGMGRQVFEGEADISISQSILHPNRSQGFTFLHPTHTGTVAAFFRQPRSTYFRNIYYHAFGIELWVALGAFWLLAASVVSVIFRIETAIVNVKKLPTPTTLPNAEDCGDDKESTWSSMLWAIATQCQQGSCVHPKSGSLKIVVISSSICGLITYVALSGALVSMLSTEAEPIRNLNDLLFAKLKIFTDYYVPFVEDIFEHGVKPNSSDFNSKLHPPSTAVTMENAIPKIMSTGSAFITLPDGFMTVFRRFNYTDVDFCNLVSTLRVVQRPYPVGMFIRKGSKYKEPFNQKIVLTIERGLNSRHNRRYVLGTTAQCAPVTIRCRKELDLLDLYSGFAILGGGHLICSVVGIFEQIWFRFGNAILTRSNSYKLSGH